MVKQRQVNQLTTPIDIAKAMYERQHDGVMDTILGQPKQQQRSEMAEVNEIVRQIMLQSEADLWQ